MCEREREREREKQAKIIIIIITATRKKVAMAPKSLDTLRSFVFPLRSIVVVPISIFVASKIFNGD